MRRREGLDYHESLMAFHDLACSERWAGASEDGLKRDKSAAKLNWFWRHLIDPTGRRMGDRSIPGVGRPEQKSLLGRFAEHTKSVIDLS
jgi:hypothetical protein